MPGYGQEIDRIKSGKEQSSSDTGSEKGWPKYGNYALNDGYVGAFRLHRRISCGFHVVRPQRGPIGLLMDRWSIGEHRSRSKHPQSISILRGASRLDARVKRFLPVFVSRQALAAPGTVLRQW